MQTLQALVVCCILLLVSLGEQGRGNGRDYWLMEQISRR
jgi:hypothetical protein